MAENTHPNYVIQGTEVRNPDGDVEGFHAVDPVTGAPSYFPNYTHPDGSTLYDQLGGGGGGSGAGVVDPADSFGTQTPQPSTGEPDPGLVPRLTGETIKDKDGKVTSFQQLTPDGQKKWVDNGVTDSKTGETVYDTYVKAQPPPSGMPAVDSPDAPADNGSGKIPLSTSPTTPKGPHYLPNGMYVDENGHTFDQSQTSNSYTSKHVDPHVLANMQAQGGELEQAIKGKLAADVSLNNLAGQQAQQQADSLKELNENHALARAQYEKQVAQRMAVLQDQTDEASNAKIDTAHYWADKTTGDKVLAGVSIMLGALGQGLSGGEHNVGMDLIDKAITRDIEAQKANLENKRLTLGAQKGLVQEYASQFKDKEVAADAAYLTYWKQVQAQFEATATGSKNQLLVAQAKEAAAQANLKIDEFTAKLTESTATSTKQTSPLITAPKPLPGDLEKHMNTLSEGINTLKRVRGELDKSDGSGLGLTGGLEAGASKIGLGDRNTVINNRSLADAARNAKRKVEEFRRPGQKVDDELDTSYLGSKFTREDNQKGIDKQLDLWQQEFDDLKKQAQSAGPTTTPIPGIQQTGTSAKSFKKLGGHHK